MNVQLLKWYSQQGLSRAIDIFNEYTSFTPMHKVLGYRFLLQYGYMDPGLAPSREKILEQMKQKIAQASLYESKDNNSFVMDMVDILLEFFPEEGEKLLEELRNNKMVANGFGPCQEGIEGTIYSDSQSSHNQQIKESVVRAATKLVRENPFSAGASDKISQAKIRKKNSISSLLISSMPEHTDIITEVLERIDSDNAIFGPDQIMCDDVFLSLFLWIEKQQQLKKPVEGIYQRLREELLEMHRYCSSGILTRLINVMQGFTDDEGYDIRISTEEQCCSVVYNYINKALQECEDEEVMEGMLERTPKYLRYVKTQIGKMFPQWKKEYGEEFYALLKPTINKYIGVNVY